MGWLLLPDLSPGVSFLAGESPGVAFLLATIKLRGGMLFLMDFALGIAIFESDPIIVQREPDQLPAFCLDYLTDGPETFAENVDIR